MSKPADFGVKLADFGVELADFGVEACRFWCRNLQILEFKPEILVSNGLGVDGWDWSGWMDGFLMQVTFHGTQSAQESVKV